MFFVDNMIKASIKTLHSLIVLNEAFFRGAPSGAYFQPVCGFVQLQ